MMTADLFATFPAGQDQSTGREYRDNLHRSMRMRALCRGALPVRRPDRPKLHAPVLAVLMALSSAGISVMGQDVAGMPDMVRIEGDTIALSLGRVTVRSFMIGRYEVTWAQWRSVREWAVDNGYDLADVGGGSADAHPVHSVNWFDALKWCNALSEKTGLTPVYRVNGTPYRQGEVTPEWDRQAGGYRLPAEAEWEFAARGGRQTRGYAYSGNDALDEVAWHWDNSGGAEVAMHRDMGTWPVGQKSPNELELHDMSGNVWEWCWDANGDLRHRRGGAWNSTGHHCNPAHRFSIDPQIRNGRPGGGANGLRLARNAE